VSTRRSEPASNRERILIEAARLFARRGYHATTTRQIAQAVGIRQPSLFHHFPSKRAIVQEILRSDLDEAVPSAEALASGPGPAGVRLYRYVRHDVEHLIGSPYDLRGMYTEEVMGDPSSPPGTRNGSACTRPSSRSSRTASPPGCSCRSTRRWPGRPSRAS